LALQRHRAAPPYLRDAERVPAGGLGHRVRAYSVRAYSRTHQRDAKSEDPGYFLTCYKHRSSPCLLCEIT
jgi:hypothetical protein